MCVVNSVVLVKARWLVVTV